MLKCHSATSAVHLLDDRLSMEQMLQYSQIWVTRSKQAIQYRKRHTTWHFWWMQNTRVRADVQQTEWFPSSVLLLEYSVKIPSDTF